MSDEETTQRFKLVLKQIPVELETPGGDIIPCVIQDLPGKHRDAYLNKLGKRVDTKGGDSRVKDFVGIYADLLVRSLYKVTTDELEPFTIAEIQEFPGSVQKELYNMSRKLSRLEDDGDDDDDEGTGGND